MLSIGATCKLRPVIAGLWFFHLAGAAHADAGRAAISLEQPQVREELVRCAAVYLGEWLRSRADRFDVVVDHATVPDLKLPPGSVEIRARPLPADAQPTARMPLWLDLSVDGRFVRSVLLTGRVKAYRSAWKAGSDLAAGTRLHAQFLDRGEIDVAALGAAPWTGEPEGSVLRTRLLRGEALTASNVVAAPAVARGDRVMLSSRVGGIEVWAAGQAMQDATVGQRIQVRLDAARTPVLATVREPGRLEIGK